MIDRKTELLPTAYALRLANRWARGGVCSMREGDAQRYHAACAAALHEKLEREEWSKGCEFCNAVHTDWTEGGAHDFRLSGDTLCYFDHVFGWEGVKIRYCPMCGRKLKDGTND